MVVLSEREVESGPEELGRVLQYLVDNDDVCTDEFTGIIVEKPSASVRDPDSALGDHDLSTSAFGPAPSRYPSLFHLVGPEPHSSQARSQLPSGPYFLSGQNLHQAWRLYPDELEAFTFGLIPDDVFNATRYLMSSSLLQTSCTSG